MSNSVPTQFFEDYQEWARRARAAEAKLDRVSKAVVSAAWEDHRRLMAGEGALYAHTVIDAVNEALRDGDDE